METLVPRQYPKNQSLSARRAWIEIIDYIIDYVNDAVALRKESVDRNYDTYAKVLRVNESLSARRAWIEISYTPRRNALLWRRSPQGERG